MDVIIHTNITLAHQRAYAQYFQQGFNRHGLTSEITADIKREGDIHVIQGPHYAKDYWQGRHDHVILLDRELYHPEITSHPRSMDWVSIGWMRPDGGRYFQNTGGRLSPSVKDRPTKGGIIFLADYGGKVERADTVRLHPANKSYDESLLSVLRRHRTAIGYQTSALVTAGLEGLEVVCKDRRNIMWKSNWLELLPYADWHYSEIQSGLLWEHLWLVRQL